MEVTEKSTTTEQIIESESKKTIPVGDMSRTGFSLTSIKIAEGSAQELENILAKRIDGARGAYRNSPIVLNVEDVGNLNSFDFYKLQEVCREHELFLVGVTGVINEDRAEALTRRRIPVVNSNRYARIREENLKPRIITQYVEVKVPVEVPVPYKVEVPVEVKVPAPVKILRRRVHSGEKINGMNSSIAIYGSIGSLARIIASQHVFIFGDVNGAEIFAGSPKDQNDPGMTNAIIHVTGRFNPGVIAIAGNYRTAEDLDKDPVLNNLKGRNSGIVVELDEQARLQFYPGDDYSSRR